jgi:hypothetical protein
MALNDTRPSVSRRVAPLATQRARARKPEISWYDGLCLPSRAKRPAADQDQNPVPISILSGAPTLSSFDHDGTRSQRTIAGSRRPYGT